MARMRLLGLWLTLSLLVALLLPALSRARLMAQRADCAVRQRQITTAVTTFAVDGDSRFVRTHRWK